jgi:hypothetical protein|tara:strand:+ start:24355 stop:24531 length:177 start_codon:yes stop_codon:yes gene_type:complete
MKKKVIDEETMREFYVDTLGVEEIIQGEIEFLKKKVLAHEAELMEIRGWIRSIEDRQR